MPTERMVIPHVVASTPSKRRQLVAPLVARKLVAVIKALALFALLSAVKAVALRMRRSKAGRATLATLRVAVDAWRSVA